MNVYPYTEKSLAFSPSSFPKSVIRRTDLDIDKSDFCKHFTPGFARKTTGNSASPKINVA